MSVKYHNSPVKGPMPCVASVRGCAYGENTPHYNSRAEAQAAYDLQNSAYNVPKVISKKSPRSKKRSDAKIILKSMAVTGVGIVLIGSLSNMLQTPSTVAVPDRDDTSITEIQVEPPVVETVETGGNETVVDRENPTLRDIKDIRVDDTGRTVEDYGKAIGKKAGEAGSVLKEYAGEAGSVLKEEIDTYLFEDETTGTKVSANDVIFRGEVLTPSSYDVQQAADILSTLDVVDVYDGRYGEYNREDWGSYEGSKSTIQQRDILNGTFNNDGRVVSGSFIDPYTGEKIVIGETDINLDHIISLNEAHYSQTRELSPEEKNALANDARNLQYVGESINKSKGRKDAGEWLPTYDASQCSYAIANIEVKASYDLSVDSRELNALNNILETKCG